MYERLVDNPGLKVELSGMLVEASRRGRERAVDPLVEHDGQRDWAAEKRVRRVWGGRLPADCPYAL